MKKKYSIIFLWLRKINSWTYKKPLVFLIIIFVIYFYLAHAYIYYKIGQAHLKATDNMHTYNIGNQSKDPQLLVYAALGDSLTAGVGMTKYEESYPYLLAEYLAGTGGNIIHKNYSYPGATTKNLIDDLIGQVIIDQPDIITVLIGVNDVHGFVDKVDFEKNYDFILRELTTKTKASIYLINIPHIGSASLILPPYSNYFDYKIDQFNKIIYNLAKSYNLSYIDLSSSTMGVLKKDGLHYSTDLFHPSALGYNDWAKIIYDYFNK